MNVIQNFSAIGKKLKARFKGTGGVEPYTYAVTPGGAGGSINSDGIYTPLNYGNDEIVVTDDNGDTATTNITVGDPLVLLCDIIQKEMGLPNGAVYLYNQKYILPKDSGVYVSVGVVSAKPYANTNRWKGTDAEFKEVQSINVNAMLDINIMSRSTEALMRKEEILMAVNSIYAKQQQSANGFYIATLSNSFNNLSDLDGSSIPYRFNISLSIQYAIEKVKSVTYYDDFEETVILNK